MLIRFLLRFNKCTLYARGQTASVSAKPCGLNFHRLGLPLIVICAHAGPQRVRFTDCGAEVFPVLGSATSTEVPQPHEGLSFALRWIVAHIQNHFRFVTESNTIGCLPSWCVHNSARQQKQRKKYRWSYFRTNKRGIGLETFPY